MNGDNKNSLQMTPFVDNDRCEQSPLHNGFDIQHFVQSCLNRKKWKGKVTN